MRRLNMNIKSTSNRNISMDIFRIFCCYCIIALHISGHLDTTGYYWKTIQVFVRPALWSFMALSGYFLLHNKIYDWKAFYYKHLLFLAIPLFVYSIVYQLVYSNYDVKALSLKAIISGDSYGHMWYVYTLLTLYLLIPFIQTMLSHINNQQFIFLLMLSFFFGRVIPVISALGFPIALTSEIGNTPLFYLLLGAFIRRIKITKYFKFIITLGLINILYGIISYSNNILANGAANLSATTLIGVITYFCMFLKLQEVVFENKNHHLIEKVASFISARTFGIYLIHMLIFQMYINHKIMVLEGSFQYWGLPLKCLSIFIIGLLIATILDFCICKPINKIINLLLKQLHTIKSSTKNANLK